MSARDDYPHLADAERYGIPAPLCDVAAALDEIDRLRAAARAVTDFAWERGVGPGMAPLVSALWRTLPEGSPTATITPENTA